MKHILIAIAIALSACSGATAQEHAAPLPTYTPTPAHSEEEIEYGTEISRLLTSLVSTLNELQLLKEEMEADVTLVVDNDWRLRAGLIVGQTELTTEQIRELQPPQRYEEIHSNFVDALDHLDRSTAAYTEGLDAYPLWDADALERHNTELDIALDGLNVAARQLIALGPK